MGRPPKKGLNYSTWDVNVLETDPDMDKLIDSQGPAGFFVYFALCQRAYGGEGYYLPFERDTAPSLARRLGGGLSARQVEGIVDRCLSIGLFEKDLWNRHGILTSRAIQRRYLEGIQRRTGPIEIYKEYWLLETKIAPGLIFVPLNGVSAYKNQVSVPQEPGFCTVDEINRNKMNPNILFPEKNLRTKSDRIAACTRLLAYAQSLDGINWQGDKELRKKVYGLFDRGVSPEMIRRVLDHAATRGQRITTPNALGQDWDRLMLELTMKGA